MNINNEMEDKKIADGVNRKHAVWQAVIISLAMVGLLYLMAALTSEMGYLTVDDGDIQHVLSGNMTGETEYIHQNITPLLSVPMGGLYRLFPGIQWWYIYSQILQGFGLFMVHFSLIRMAQIKREGWWVPVVFLAIYDIGAVCYLIMNVGFSTVPAVLLAGIIAYYIYKSLEGEFKMRHVWWTMLPIFLACIHRIEGALAALCYVLLAFLFYVFTTKKNLKKKIITSAGYILILVVMALGLRALDNYIKHQVYSEEFYEFAQYRANFNDYPMDTYEENPALYEAVGWDEHIYFLAKHWCFMPDEVNGEAFEYLATHTNTSTIGQMQWEKLLEGLEELTALASAWLVALILSAIATIGGRNWRAFLAWGLNFVGTVILILFQIYLGRIRYHTLAVEIVPSIALNLSLLLYMGMLTQSRRKALWIVTGVLAAAGMFFWARADFSPERREYIASKASMEKAYYEYVIAHPDNVYICTSSALRNVTPESIYIKGHPSNLIRYGDSSYMTAPYMKQLAKNGYDTLSGEMFKDDNVYFIITTNVRANHAIGEDSVFSHFFHYLQKDHGAIGFVKVERMSDEVAGYVYQFVFDENKDAWNTYLTLEDGMVVKVKR